MLEHEPQLSRQTSALVTRLGEMPRYFFDLDIDRHADDIGVDLANSVAAYEEATCYLRDLMKDHSAELLDHGQLTLTVSDETRSAVIELALLVRQSQH